MPLITTKIPESWEELEDLVTAILNECGMKAQRQVTLKLPRGTVDVDVVAEETVDGIVHVTVCECKNWSTNIPKEIVHAFRTVMHETGANRGYIISRTGFQTGAIEAAAATNINLVTFAEFQYRYFDKWYRHRLWQIERAIGDFKGYYEPFGKPGYHLLQSDTEREIYDRVWYEYLYAGLMLMHFSPYLEIVGKFHVPLLPFDVASMEDRGVFVPEAAKAAAGHRELLALLEDAAGNGLRALRKVNPITRNQAPESVLRDD